MAEIETINGNPIVAEVASESIQPSVDAWMAAHPEATTTVQDGAISTAKLANGAVTDAKLVQTGGVLSEVHDIRRLNDGLLYRDAGDVTRAQFEAMKDVIASNVLYQAESVSVLDTDGTVPAYVYKAVLKKSNLTVGDVYTFAIESATGSGSAPVAIYIKKANNANVRSVAGNLSISITITQADIDGGASYVEFDLYPAKGTGPLAQPAVFTNVVVYAGNSKQVGLGPIISDAIDEVDGKISQLCTSNVLYEADSVTVSGGGNFVYKDVVVVTDFAVGDHFVFAFDGFTGASQTRCAYINIDNSSGGHVRGVVGYGNTADVTIGADDIADGATKVVFRLYPATGTPLPTGSAVFDNVIVYKGNAPYEAGDVLESLMSPMLSSTVKTIAHRGDDVYAPQCTAASYKEARKRGHNIAENDVWHSSDGVYVMWHDENLSKLGTYLFDVNGYYLYTDGSSFYWYDASNAVLYDQEYQASSASIGDLTQCAGANYGVADYGGTVTGLPYAVLEHIDFGAYKGFSGEHILTFGEWVLLCKQLGMEIYIDKKFAYSDDDVAALFATVRNLGMKDKTHWIVSMATEAQMVKAEDANARMLVLQNPTTALIEAYSQFNTGRGFAFNGNGKTITQAEVQLGLGAGFEVECWYVDVPTISKSDQFAKIQQLVSYGVTGLTLDHYRVDEAFAYLLS